MALTHEQISEKFLASNAIQFDGLAKFVGEFGPELVAQDDGLHGVMFGRYNILACMLTASDLSKLVGDLGMARQLAAAAQKVRK